MMSCQKITCGLPKVFPLTNLTDPENVNKILTYSDVVEYGCQTGHTIGGTPDGQTEFEIKCQADAQLSDPKVCEAVKCGEPPRLTKARAGISASLFYGMSVMYQCDTGYTLSGSPHGANSFSLSCESDGKFSSLNGIKCQPVSAGRLPTIPNAVLKEYSGRTVPTGSTVVAYYPAGFKYVCKSGYSLTGSSSGAVQFVSQVTSIGSIQPSLPLKCKRIEYTLQGEVKDARTGRGIDDVTVEIEGHAQKINSRNGFFTFQNVPKGRYTFKYEKDGFISTTQVLDIQANVNNGGICDINMSPRMLSSQWRATLKWDSQPRDLDTYVKWGWTKMYWAGTYQSSSDITARLEKDDTDGYGPETAYLTGVGSCRGDAYKCDIKYEINDYTRSRSMPNYRAEVTLYTGDHVAGTWKLSDCPNAVSQDKNWWHVFTIDGQTNKLKWHCGEGGGGAALVKGRVDYQNYRGPFPGRFFRHHRQRHRTVYGTMHKLRGGNNITVLQKSDD